jgi:hypothetical protein
MVDEAAAAALELELDEFVPVVAAACGRAAAGLSACAAVECCKTDDNTDITFSLSSAG